MITDLVADRADLVSRIAEKQAEQGKSILDGKSFDSRELSRLEGELKGIDLASAERVRRERDEASAEWAEIRQRQLAELAQLEDRRLDAVGKAERAARDLAAVLTELKEISRQEAAHAGRLGIATLSISPVVFEKRLSNRLGAVLQGATGGNFRFGYLELHKSHRSASDDWVAQERAELSLPQG